MRVIGITKPCTDEEKEYIMSSVNNDDRVLFFESEQEMLESDEINNIEIVLGEPEVSTVEALTNLRWIQMSWAGANKYVSSKDKFENIELTTASGAYGVVISEYVVAGMLALYRNLFKYRDNMQKGGWEKIDQEDTLEGKRVLILGTGDIGTQTAKKIKPFGATVIGMCRTKKDNLGEFDEIYTIDNLDEQLSLADAIVITLPGTDETTGLFDAEKISKIKPGALFVNIGRGFIVDTDALTLALKEGKIWGAVLDVMDPEPLPDNHPLRTMKNVMLTPHISGIGWGTNRYTRKRILDILCSNLRSDSNSEKKTNIIDFDKGY